MISFPASQEGHINIVEYLIQFGACPLVQNHDGWSPIHVASMNGYLDILQALTRHNPFNLLTPGSENRSPVHYAAENGHINIMKHIMEVFEHYDDLLNQRCNRGWTPMHWAAFGGQFEMVKYLDEHMDGLTDLPNYLGETPSYIAEHLGHFEIVNFLRLYNPSSTTETILILPE